MDIAAGLGQSGKAFLSELKRVLKVVVIRIGHIPADVQLGSQRIAPSPAETSGTSRRLISGGRFEDR